MTAFQALILGIVQGATEFLPVSSSGHLVLVPWLLGWQLDPQAAFVFDVLVQWGTLLAVIVYFWRELPGLALAALRGLIHGHPLESPAARMAWLLVLASLPAAVLGLVFKDTVEATFGQPTMVFGFLLVTSALLAVSEWLGHRTRSMESLRWTDALWIGLAQVLALFPGVSRLGLDDRRGHDPSAAPPRCRPICLPHVGADHDRGWAGCPARPGATARRRRPVGKSRPRLPGGRRRRLSGHPMAAPIPVPAPADRVHHLHGGRRGDRIGAEHLAWLDAAPHSCCSWWS